jgi:hypothetical protein
MNAEELSILLRSLKACKEALAWSKGKTLSAAWQECTRPDWMLWLCARMIDQRGWPGPTAVVLAACACAETALRFVPWGERRPAEAIRIARAWTRGQATQFQARVAAEGATYPGDAVYCAEDVAAFAAGDAAYAAQAAAYVAGTLSSSLGSEKLLVVADTAAAAAAYAARAAFVFQSHYAYAESARAKVRADMADIVRSILNIRAALTRPKVDDGISDLQREFE